jgi:hypothetical protein
MRSLVKVNCMTIILVIVALSIIASIMLASLPRIGAAGKGHLQVDALDYEGHATSWYVEIYKYNQVTQQYESVASGNSGWGQTLPLIFDVEPGTYKVHFTYEETAPNQTDEATNIQVADEWVRVTNFNFADTDISGPDMIYYGRKEIGDNDGIIENDEEVLLEYRVFPDTSGVSSVTVKVDSNSYDSHYGSGEYSTTVRPLAIGVHEILIEASDSKGNKTIVSDHFGVNPQDNVGPPPVAQASITSLTTDRNSYSVNENVSVRFTAKNESSVSLHLRYVVEIKDPNNMTVYDSHSRDEDMEVWLDSRTSATRMFNWMIPDGSTAGTYQVNANLRDWNNWDTIYDYRWGDKPGPYFNFQPSGASWTIIVVLPAIAIIVVAAVIILKKR